MDIPVDIPVDIHDIQNASDFIPLIRMDIHMDIHIRCLISIDSGTLD